MVHSKWRRTVVTQSCSTPILKASVLRNLGFLSGLELGAPRGASNPPHTSRGLNMCPQASQLWMAPQFLVTQVEPSIGAVDSALTSVVESYLATQGIPKKSSPRLQVNPVWLLSLS